MNSHKRQRDRLPCCSVVGVLGRSKWTRPPLAGRTERRSPTPGSKRLPLQRRNCALIPVEVPVLSIQVVPSRKWAFPWRAMTRMVQWKWSNRAPTLVEVLVQRHLTPLVFDQKTLNRERCTGDQGKKVCGKLRHLVGQGNGPKHLQYYSQYLKIFPLWTIQTTQYLANVIGTLDLAMQWFLETATGVALFLHMHVLLKVAPLVEITALCTRRESDKNAKQMAI
jgi:hypothetical protein